MNDLALIARGKVVYTEHCASCHGANLEGQPNWRKRLPNGRLPAPPHDATGHTWHHSDKQLFDMVKNGTAAMLPGYETDMPAYKDALSDADIWPFIFHREHMASGHSPAPATSKPGISLACCHTNFDREEGRNEVAAVNNNEAFWTTLIARPDRSRSDDD